MSRYDIRNSGYNIFGRLGLVALIVGVMFLNLTLFGPFADKDISGIWLFLGSQVFFIFACVGLLIAWAFLSIILAGIYWVVTSRWMFATVFEFPKHAGHFILKFLLGDWNRADLFRRQK